MSVITLTTDFGLIDSYVGAMKGVILSIAPAARIVDVSHSLPPQNIPRAMRFVQEFVPYFPAGTIHVVVVDPGVGSERRPIAICAADAYFVGPDNGVFSAVLEAGDCGAETGDHEAGRMSWRRDSAENSGTRSRPEVIWLNKREYWLLSISRTFHGRDIFAPVAAHLAAGVPFAALGKPIDDPVILPSSRPVRLSNGAILGHIAYVDHFGNIVSDVPAEWLAGQHWQFHIAGRQVAGLSETYADVLPGQLLGLIGSSAHLEIAVRNGSAAECLGATAGEPIEAHPRGT